MRTWIYRVLIPLWISIYITLFRILSGAIFVSLTVWLGAWKAAFLLFVVFGIWGSIFYLLLLETESIERVREKIHDLLSKRQSKLSIWLRKKFFIKGEPVHLSPVLTLLIFIIESPLSGAFIIRLAYPKNLKWKGLMWVWLGAFAEVATWFLPVYGGGISLIKEIISRIPVG